MIPNFVKMKIPKTSPAPKFTQQKATTIRINDEIK